MCWCVCRMPHRNTACKGRCYRLHKLQRMACLLALLDYRFRFMYINVGAPGRCHDSQIFENSSLKRLLKGSPLLKEKYKAMNGVSVPVVRFSSYVMKPCPFAEELVFLLPLTSGFLPADCNRTFFNLISYKQIFFNALLTLLSRQQLLMSQSSYLQSAYFPFLLQKINKHI